MGEKVKSDFANLLLMQKRPFPANLGQIMRKMWKMHTNAQFSDHLDISFQCLLKNMQKNILVYSYKQNQGMKKEILPRLPFELPAKQNSQSSPNGPNGLF